MNRVQNYSMTLTLTLISPRLVFRMEDYLSKEMRMKNLMNVNLDIQVAGHCFEQN
jgi:hypothetical protein